MLRRAGGEGGGRGGEEAQKGQQRNRKTNTEGQTGKNDRKRRTDGQSIVKGRFAVLADVMDP